MRKFLVPFGLLTALGSLAWAQSLSGYDPAFSSFPCQDGWMGCIQEGSRLDPDVQKGADAMPFAADMRVTWFDLEPTSNFSPFVKLSEYTGEAPARVTEQVAANDGSADGTDGADGTPEAGAGEDDGVADFFDPEAERARIEEENRKLAELEAKRAQEKAAEELRRAQAQADKARQEAEQRQRAAQEALRAAEAARDAEERQRLQEQARKLKEDQERARRQADEAERLRREREAQEAEERRRAEEARVAAQRAAEERARMEAEEARKREERRQAEEAARAKAEEEARKAAEAARKKAEAEAAAQAAEAQRRAEEAARKAKAAADAAERQRLEEEQRKAEEERRQAEEDSRKKAEAAAKAAEEAARAKAEEEARQRKEEEQKRLEEERKRIEEEQKAKDAAASGGEAVAAGEGGCADLVQLETVAILGNLSGDQIACLEGSLGSSTRMTQKSKISRTLMVNAFSKGDSKSWEKLMKRHLQEIEQSDPDLCYKYALHLSKKGPGSAYGVIKWANVALENRTVWTGSTYTSRVYSLYKLRAAAAQKIWANEENKHASNPTEDSNKKVKDARNNTKVFAREWYEYAKVAGKDTTTALDLCMSAAGTKDYCEAG